MQQFAVNKYIIIGDNIKVFKETENLEWSLIGLKLSSNYFFILLFVVQ